MAQDMLDTAVDRPSDPVRLREGRLFRPGGDDDTAGSDALRLMLADGFAPADATGAAMTGASATIRFAVSFDPAGGDADAVHLFLAVDPAPAAIGRRCTVLIAGAHRVAGPGMLLRPGTNLLRITLSPDADGLCACTVAVDDMARADGAGRVVLRLRAIGYSRRTQRRLRADLRESLLLA